MNKIRHLIISSSLALLSLNAFAQNVDPRTPLIATSHWDNWQLNLISLDKNDKPSDQTAIAFDKNAQVDHKSLNIIIFPDDLDPNAGKVLRFTCKKDNISITQKFGSPDQLKGFALQMPCDKTKYYFIINPK